MGRRIGGRGKGRGIDRRMGRIRQMHALMDA